MLERDFDAILLAIGAHRSRDLTIPGVELDGVHRGVDFLLNVNLGYKFTIGRNVLVIGGGNVAMDVARRTLPAEWFERGRLTLTDHQYDALDGAAALVLVTEWKPFRYPDFAVVKKRMKQPVIFDGRNLYDPVELAGLGFEYFGIGR